MQEEFMRKAHPDYLDSPDVRGSNTSKSEADGIGIVM